MYGVALFFILQKYYKNGNSGLPSPTALTAPTYLYGILALSSDFLDNFPIVLAAGLTVALIWQAQSSPTATPTGKTTPAKTSVSPTTSIPPGLTGPEG